MSISTGVVESLPLERAERGGDLFVISWEGTEDMVVEGRREGGWGHRCWAFNNTVMFVGETEDGKGDDAAAPTRGHVLSRLPQLPLPPCSRCQAFTEG